MHCGGRLVNIWLQKLSSSEKSRVFTVAVTFIRFKWAMVWLYMHSFAFVENGLILLICCTNQISCGMFLII